MRQFPILMTSSIRGPEETRTIPWNMIAPHEIQALINHGQTLENLAARGGVVPAEALAILEDRKYQPLQLTAASLMLKVKVEAWMAPTGDVFKLIDDLRAGRITPRPHHFNKIEIALQAALGSTPAPKPQVGGIQHLSELVGIVAKETGALEMTDADEDSVGWSGDGKPLPMTFGHVRRAAEALAQITPSPRASGTSK